MTTEPDQRGRIPGTAEHVRAMPRGTKRGTRLGVHGHTPSKEEERLRKAVDDAARRFAEYGGHGAEVDYWIALGRLGRFQEGRAS